MRARATTARLAACAAIVLEQAVLSANARPSESVCSSDKEGGCAEGRGNWSVAYSYRDSTRVLTWAVARSKAAPVVIGNGIVRVSTELYIITHRPHDKRNGTHSQVFFLNLSILKRTASQKTRGLACTKYRCTQEDSPSCGCEPI
jgi:hypothetical protein